MIRVLRRFAYVVVFFFFFSRSLHTIEGCLCCVTEEKNAINEIAKRAVKLSSIRMHIYLFSAQATTYSFLFDLTEKKIEYACICRREKEKRNERARWRRRKRRVNHECFGPFHTNMYIQMDYLSVVCIRHLLTFFSLLSLSLSLALSCLPIVCILFRNEPICLSY